MKQIKRIALMLAVVLAIVGLLAGCGKKKDSAQSGQPQQTIEQTDESEEGSKTDINESDAADTEQADAEDDPGQEEEPASQNNSSKSSGKNKGSIKKNGTYTKKDDVALYLNTYGKLPPNFITKKEARKLGWSGGYLEPYAPGKCIGGDEFANYEGVLPEDFGRTYYECDIDTLRAKKRGAKRIVYSDDGLIYYTDDHYETFTLLYGKEG